MDLVNHTPYPAGLFGGCIDEERLCAGLIVRSTYDLDGDRLRPSAEQIWKVSGGPWEGPQGPMPGDDLFYRGGVDLFVFGRATPPQAKAAKRVDVVVEVGRFRHAVAVFGDRVWNKHSRGLSPSEPEPIRSIPLTIQNAYGGKDVWDELPIPFPSNPDGKGFYVSMESAAGKPLPNIELPGVLIQQWNDQPEPAGVGLPPVLFGPRLDRAIEVNPQTKQISKIRGLFFNAAFPAMIAPHGDVFPGANVRVNGVLDSGPLAFRLPRLPLQVRLRFGDEITAVDPYVDQVGIEVAERRVFVAYRYAFRYRMIPLQKRVCELLPAA